jgi:Uncharacterized protein involved in exopolysaccharide biosynthesis
MFKRWWWLLLVLIVVGPFIGFLTAVVVTYVMPKKYESVAVISPVFQDRVILADEVKLLKSQEVLSRLSKNEDLSKRWMQDEAGVHATLGDAIVVTPLRGTDLISIKTRLPSRDDALGITEGLIKAYEEHHNELRKSINEPAFKDVVRIISTQEDKISDLKKAFSVTDKGDERAEKLRQEIQGEEKKLRDLKMEFTLKGVPSPFPEQVSVHEPASRPLSPVSPNVPANLVMGLVGGLLVSPVIAILLMMLFEKIWPARQPG